MAIDGIKWADNTLTSSTAIGGKGTADLDMNDFLNLMVAQMTNQDMLNPMEDTEFIAQMAQFSALQGIQSIQEYQLANYAASYAGKYVTIADTDGLGQLKTISGKVEAVTYYDGTPMVQVNGETYDLYKIMEVSDTAASGTLADAAKYIGQMVTVTTQNEYNEDLETTGLVTSITMKDNVPQVIIDGKEYPVSSISKIVNEDSTDDEDTSSTDTAAAAARSTTAASSATDSTEIAALKALGAEVAKDLKEEDADRSTAGYSDQQILGYAHYIALPKTGASIRTAQEIYELIKQRGSF